MTQNSLNDTMTALADPTRRAILVHLRCGEARVTDVAEPFNMSLNAVSKHIKLLERAHLVSRRKDGRQHFIAFNPEPLREASAWLEAMTVFWTDKLDALETVLNADAATGPNQQKAKEDKT